MSNRIVAVSGIALLLTAFAGCGGSGGTDAPGNSSTNRTTVGQITGFGSVYVNGIEFETAGANYEVDDVLASNDDALAVGMVVKVEGAVNADGLTGTAYGISNDDDRLDEDDDEVGAKGMLVYEAATGTWSVKGIDLAFDDGTEYKPLSLRDMIADQSAAGMLVEVEGKKIGEALQVDEIELGEDELKFKAEVAVKSNGDTLTLSFGDAMGTVDVIVKGETMFRDDDTLVSIDYDTINVDDKVEIEARWGDDGAIYASNLHLEDGSDYEIEGPVGSIDAVSVDVLEVVYVIDPAVTAFEDGVVPVAGDFVEIEDDNDDGIADRVEIED